MFLGEINGVKIEEYLKKGWVKCPSCDGGCFVFIPNGPPRAVMMCLDCTGKGIIDLENVGEPCK